MKHRVSFKKTVFYIAVVAALSAVLSAFCFAANVSAPQISQLVVKNKTSSTVTLEWKVSGKASGYRVYRYIPATKKYVRLKNLKAKTFTVTDLVPGEYYVFSVRPYVVANNKVFNGKVKSKTAYTNLDRVQKIVQNTTEPYSHRLSWSKVRGSEYYEIWYYKKESGKYVRLGGGSQKNTCNLTKLNPASVYKYKIRAVSITSNGKFVFSKFSNAFSAVTGVPPVKGFKATAQTTESYKLTWNAVQNAQGYCLYRFSNETGDYERIAILNSTEYAVSGKKSAERNSYKICAYSNVNGKRIFGEMSSVLDTSTRPESVNLYKGEDAYRNNKVKLEWDKCPNADGYFIYVSKNPDSGFSLVKDVSDCEITETVVKDLENTVLYFRIKSYILAGDNCVLSKESETVRILV